MISNLSDIQYFIMPPVITRATPTTSPTPESIIEDQDLLIQYISNSQNDVTALAQSDSAVVAIMKVLQSLVINNNVVLDKLSAAEGRITDLETTNVELLGNLEAAESKVSNLENQMNFKNEQLLALKGQCRKLEQYSRRGTAILTGVSYNVDENLEEKVCKIVNCTNILPMEFDTSYISHVHCNRANPQSKKPPSITLSFVRSIDKDRLMTKKKQFKESVSTKLPAYGKNINLHHLLSPACVTAKSELENFDEVLWVDYRGHIKNFVVKLKNGEFIRNISNATDLQTKVGQLTPTIA